MDRDLLLHPLPCRAAMAPLKSWCHSRLAEGGGFSDSRQFVKPLSFPSEKVTPKTLGPNQHMKAQIGSGPKR